MYLRIFSTYLSLIIWESLVANYKQINARNNDHNQTKAKLPLEGSRHSTRSIQYLQGVLFLAIPLLKYQLKYKESEVFAEIPALNV